MLKELIWASWKSEGELLLLEARQGAPEKSPPSFRLTGEENGKRGLG